VKKRTWNLAIVEPNFIIGAGLARIFARTAFKERIECADMDQLWVSLKMNSEVDLFLIDIESDIAPFACDIHKLKGSFPNASIVLMADHVGGDMVGKAMQAGVHGLIAKGMRIDAIIKSLELILLGEPFFPPALAKKSQPLDTNGSRSNGHAHHVNDNALNLSSREIEVLMSLSEGKSNKEIARVLDISDATVKVHVKAILRKLQMKNRTEAALWAIGGGGLNMSLHQH
jgi:two-component system nitrate/nitrite response regulator NarL